MVIKNQKNNSSHFNFIIVGQGIAGSVLAISLIRAGYTVCVINEPSLSLSSKVAAGIWNPVVFKRLTKSWLADELIPELLDFYSHCEKEFNTTLITKRKIIKSFTEEQEKNLWLKKAETENRFLENNVYEHLKISDTESLNSYSHVLDAGNLDMNAFLNESKKYIEENQNYIEDDFDHTHLKTTETGIEYKTITADHITFCEGYLVHKNPLFNWIPMKPAKGEVITIRCENLFLEHNILNKGIFILPLGDNTYKVGATYEWENLNDVPTEQKKRELIEKLNTVINIPFEILKHEAGVRPSVSDRRPVVGKHPELNHHFIFNGFGTKAVMLAPYFAKQLVKHFQTGSEIDKEVDPKRFFK